MVTDPCPRGAAYDRPWFGFGSCDDGYVASSGMIIQGYGNQCVCAESDPGKEIIHADDWSFGFDTDKLLIAISAIIVIAIIAYLLINKRK